VETRRSIIEAPRAPVDLARDAVASPHPHSCASRSDRDQTQPPFQAQLQHVLLRALSAAILFLLGRFRGVIPEWSSLVATLAWSCAALLGVHSLDTRRETYLVLVSS
jgi:hypothetical protein